MNKRLDEDFNNQREISKVDATWGLRMRIESASIE